ncbi:MAG TPA: hypothetical protein VMT93_04510 [Gemmatimonadaceae bacterium]|nr:hypothetical protein [Gemmatimonadaceae bacterium]
MDRSSDDIPPDQPPRRSGKPFAPPFSAPRTGEGKAEPSAPGKRRSTPLFVPPGSIPAEPPAAAPRERAMPEFDDAPSPPPAAAKLADPPASPPRDSRPMQIENLEPEEISLRITGERPAIGDSTIDVIAYDDANGALRADTPEGKRPRVDGLELESTELTLEPPSRPTGPPAGLEIESFWAAEAFSPSQTPLSTPPESSAPISSKLTEPPADAPPRRSTMDALRVEEVMPPRMPTPPKVRAVSPPVARPSTPVSAARGMPAPDIRTPRQLEALKEAEPWAPVPDGPPADPRRYVAEALERVAQRIRAGELRLADDANSQTDENALSSALQALVRAPRR